jgi:hypothetical protein
LVDAKLLKQFLIELSTPTQRGRGEPPLAGEARRLIEAANRLIALRVVAARVDTDAVELACFSLQLPMRSDRTLSVGRFGVVSLRDRCEQAAELMVGVAGEIVDDSLLDRTARILHEMPQKTPVIDEAKLLADVVNLDDFGASGILRNAVQLGAAGHSVEQVFDSLSKRDQYGYWDARMRDGFHFEASRLIARGRLDNLRRIITLLNDESAGK